MTELMRDATVLRKAWPAEFDDGARCAFALNFPGEREAGGYPKGFHTWPLAQRDAWFCGYNKGRCDRLCASKKEAA